MAKMARVYYIVDNPDLKRRKVMRDHHLAVFILCLGAIDIVILSIYSLVEGTMGKLTATKHVNLEHPVHVEGLLRLIHHYFIYTCMRPERQITLGVLYGYKALLQLLAVILALKTRKVKVKGLDDSRYIIAATYVSSLALLTVIIMTYTAQEYIHTYATVTSTSFLLGSTIIVGLVFVPKMVIMYRDPNGRSVMKRDSEPSNGKSGRVTTMYDISDVDSLKVKIEVLERKISQYELQGLTYPPSSASLNLEEDRSHDSGILPENEEPSSTGFYIHDSDNEVQMPSHPTEVQTPSHSEEDDHSVDTEVKKRTLQLSNNGQQMSLSSEEQPHQVTIDTHPNGALHEGETVSSPEQACELHTRQNNIQPSPQHAGKLTLGFSNPGLDLCHE